MIRSKFLTILLGAVFVTGLVFSDVADAQKRSSSGSRSSFGGSSSSRPKSGGSSLFGGSSKSSKPGGSTSGSKPMFGGGSSSSKPGSTSPSKPMFGSGGSSSSKPGGTSPSGSKPMFGSGGSTKPTQPSKPMFGSGGSSSKPGSTSPSKPMFGSGGSSKPSTGSSKPSTGSSKPSSSFGSSSSKASANKAAASKRTYEQTQKATAPPKSSYTTSTGQTVNVRKDSSAVQTMRSKPSSYYTPTQRTQRTEVHIHNYGYSRPYSYYQTYDPFYVGGGYSSAFWWMMMEWNAERRARWLYNNRANIEASAYQRGMQDAQVAAAVAQMEAQGVQANPDYVDPEFADNPDLMYSQDYVEAAYNPTVVQSSGGGAAGTILMWILIIGILGFLGFFLLTKVRFGR